MVSHFALPLFIHYTITPFGIPIHRIPCLVALHLTVIIVTHSTRSSLIRTSHDRDLFLFPPQLLLFDASLHDLSRTPSTLVS